MDSCTLVKQAVKEIHEYGQTASDYMDRLLDFSRKKSTKKIKNGVIKEKDKKEYNTIHYKSEVLNEVIKNNVFKVSEEDKKAYTLFCKNFKGYRTTIHLKKCPECQTPWEKDGGCYQVECGLCGCEFCWYCGRTSKMCRTYTSNVHKGSKEETSVLYHYFNPSYSKTRYVAWELVKIKNEKQNMIIEALREKAERIEETLEMLEDCSEEQYEQMKLVFGDIFRRENLIEKALLTEIFSQSTRYLACLHNRNSTILEAKVHGGNWNKMIRRMIKKSEEINEELLKLTINQTCESSEETALFLPGLITIPEGEDLFKPTSVSSKEPAVSLPGLVAIPVGGDDLIKPNSESSEDPAVSLPGLVNNPTGRKDLIWQFDLFEDTAVSLPGLVTAPVGGKDLSDNHTQTSLPIISTDNDNQQPTASIPDDDILTIVTNSLDITNEPLVNFSYHS